MCFVFFFFFFKQKTAYEILRSDWSSDVCSSDLPDRDTIPAARASASFRGHATARTARQIGRASCRERVCQYVQISVVAASFKKKKQNSDGTKPNNNGIEDTQIVHTKI